MTERWMTGALTPVAHAFTPASSGQAVSYCGQYTVTVDRVHEWRRARQEEQACVHCAALIRLARQ